MIVRLASPADSLIGGGRRLNAIWLKGEAERIARMRGVTALIDVPVDIVVLETQRVKVTESDPKAIGVDFDNANGQIGGLRTRHYNGSDSNQA